MGRAAKAVGRKIEKLDGNPARAALAKPGPHGDLGTRRPASVQDLFGVKLSAQIHMRCPSAACGSFIPPERESRPTGPRPERSPFPARPYPRRTGAPAGSASAHKG